MKFKVELENSLDSSSMYSASGAPLGIIEEKEKKNYIKVKSFYQITIYDRVKSSNHTNLEFLIKK